MKRIIIKWTLVVILCACVVAFGIYTAKTDYAYEKVNIITDGETSYSTEKYCVLETKDDNGYTYSYGDGDYTFILKRQLLYAGGTALCKYRFSLVEYKGDNKHALKDALNDLGMNKLDDKCYTLHSGSVVE